ncbi:MAG: flagellar biosynthetic protein FliR [Lachnospiraceae bacterium]|nr:flagellar biosynthetic protein FliR [Lachnospiraceae bacterium]
MIILFALVFMRMTGAIMLNPVLGRSNIPGAVKGATIFVLSFLLYGTTDGVLVQEPTVMLEFGFMLFKELMVGFAIGFSMELCFVVVRFAAAVVDYTMGLSMAQVYDPQYNTQMTITSGMYYTFLVLLFLTGNGHVHLLGLIYHSAQLVPFGQVHVQPQLGELMLEIFKRSIVMGMQFAFPIIAMELVTEAAVGILMRVIPQINVFSVNFQLKIIVGLLMLVFLFNPMAGKLYTVIDNMFIYIEEALMVLS